MRSSLLFLTLLLPAVLHAQAPPRTLTSPTPEGNGRFGYSVSGVPDADGDGRGDLLIGAYREGGVEFGPGRAYLFSGATGVLLRTLLSPNPYQGGEFGLSVSGVADVNGDALGDLLVGAAQEGGFNGSGRAYLFPSSGLSVTASGNPTTIPPGGTVTVILSNTTGQPTPLDLWVVVEADGSPALTRLIGSGTLPANTTAIRSFPLRSPGGTPPGPYTVNVNVGEFPNTVAASDAFDVTVTGSALAGDVWAEPFVVEAVAGDVFAGDALTPSSVSASSAMVAVSPNPFVGQTALRFALAETSPVRLSVHDMLGREVAVLLDGTFEAGAHAAPFDGRGLASGVYVWRLTAGRSVQTGRLTLLE